MPKMPRISDAEWQVMNLLWADSPQTASDVVDALAGANNWSAATVKTLLNRLVKKGAIKFRVRGKRYLYSPAVSRAACVRSETRGLADRLFGGAVGPMIAHFVEDAKLTPSEIAQLRKLLEEKGR
jgi:BlaI family penicillinase repressor